MNLQLQDKTALVTGSTKGIGFAIAEALAAEGASVIVNGRSREACAKAVGKLPAGGQHEAIAADLGTAAGAALLFAKLPEVDILVNNLGIFEPKAFPEITDADWLRFFEINVLSGIRITRQYLPGMLKKNWGRVIFISSESGLQPPPEMVHYGMTKTAQLSVSRGLAETTTGTGVTVNAVLPGPTRSEGVIDFFGKLAVEAKKSPEQMEKEFFKLHRPSSILQRLAEPSEVASLVAYLASPLSSATNGAALRADGGVYRSIS